MTRISAHTETVLNLFDAGKTPVQIITETDASKRVVYAILRRHRPTRMRAPRTRTSTIPAKVHRLNGEGISVQRIAELLEVTPVYVYRILAAAQ